MSFKFLFTINSRCTTVELALSVDGLLKNVLAQHLPDTLYIFCGNIDMNPLGFVPDLSMRGVDNSIEEEMTFSARLHEGSDGD
jgi:hypothetical protein